MPKPEMLERSGRHALDTFNRKVSLGRAQSYRKTAEHIDEAHNEQSRLRLV
jgi:hypothetical protein